LSQPRDQTILEILEEAKKLKVSRSESSVYYEKCENLVVRIKGILEKINFQELDSKDIDNIKSIKELILAEEAFAKSCADLRDPKKWLGLQNDGT
jgi:hypothetical protein